MELHDAEEAIGMRKISPNLQTKENTLWIFTDSHGVMRVPKSNLHPRTKFHQLASLTPKSSTCCYFFKCFVFIDMFKKKRLL